MSVRMRRPGMPWRLCLLALCCGVVAEGAAGAGEAPRDGASPPIQVITLERDCMTCANSSRLSLHRNGTARLTLIGKARLGGVDRHSRATLARADFEALVAMLEEQGYFALSDSYDDPDTRDGAWVNWQVERGVEVKQVFCRSGLEPAALLRLEAAVKALQARLNFNPEP